MNKKEFITAVAGYVDKYASAYGILVHSSVIAQAILESGWGKSTLAVEYHNYFGLKCGTKWKGGSVNLSTKEEYTPETLTSIRDNFRTYSSMEEGVKGYFEFIQLSRYQNLKGITDPRKYLETIREDGFATSSDYVKNCMALVEQYELRKYDNAKERETMAKTAATLIAQAKAWLAGHTEVTSTDLLVLRNYFWQQPSDREFVTGTLERLCVNPMQEKVSDFLAMAQDAKDDFDSACGAAENVRTKQAALRKFRGELVRLYQMQTEMAANVASNSEKALTDGLLSELERISKAAHEAIGFTYTPLEQLAALQ